MEKVMILGGEPLSGKVRVSGAKNSVLPIIAGTLLPEEKTCLIRGVPHLLDVRHIVELIQCLGAETSWEKDILSVDARNVTRTEAPYECVSKMRASFLVMGPLLARFGHARLPLPGGCNIGTRPVDLHLKGFAGMGADIIKENGCVYARKQGRLKGTKIYLDYPSVGATENLMMAAVLADGVTIIENAAEEPEIEDLANFLNAMGARIYGGGTRAVTIEGVDGLTGVEHTVIPDRVEAGTFMIASAITGGDIYIENIVTEHLKPVIAKLREAGVSIYPNGNSVRVTGSDRIDPVNIQTLPYPGFPTDMQAQMTSLVSTAAGTSIITETVFENRFMYAGELARMGADITVDGRVAVVQGVKELQGTKVNATDLRAGAALVLAGLAAKGVTEINCVYHIDRGYENFVEKFKGLGAQIKRIN